MIFAFVEGGTLMVLENLEAVQKEFEGIDVENRVVEFYDEYGVRLKPDFVVPNKRGRFLGIFELFSWVESGIFKLVRDADPNEDTVAIKLAETTAIEKNRWFASLDDVKKHLTARGVPVEVSR